MSDAIKHITDDIFSFRKTAHWCTCIVHATQSNCCSSVNFLSLKPCPQSPKLNALTTRFRESYSSMNMSRESKRLNKSRSDWLNSGNTLTHIWVKKMQFSCSPILPGSAEAHVIWGGIVKCFLIAYFMGNISDKQYQNRFTYVKVIAKQRWHVFWDTV